MKVRQEVIVDVTKVKSITGMMTRRKEKGKKNNRESGRERVNDQVDAKRSSYSKAVIALHWEQKRFLWATPFCERQTRH